MISLEKWFARIATRLARAGVDEHRLKAEWLVSERLGIPRLEIPLHYQRRIEEQFLNEDLERLANHEPLQYVLGNTNFFGHDFITDARALIPRPETEELVEFVLQDDRNSLELVDIGTGTGCIAITIALAKPSWQVTAADLLPAALELARENANALGATTLQFRLGDLLEGLEAASLDWVVSNPPYIAEAEVQKLEPHIRNHEPLSALAGGADGTDLIQLLINQAAVVLRPGGRIMLEIGEDQGQKVEDFLHKADFTDILIHTDRFGRIRFASGRIHHG